MNARPARRLNILFEMSPPCWIIRALSRRAPMHGQFSESLVDRIERGIESFRFLIRLLIEQIKLTFDLQPACGKSEMARESAAVPRSTSPKAPDANAMAWRWSVRTPPSTAA